MPQTSSCVGTGVALARGSCAMEQMIVEMAVMRAHIRTAVSLLSAALNVKGGSVMFGSLSGAAEGYV